MAWSFGDSFDLYAAPADAINGYWDSGSAASSGSTLVAGRFAGSQSLRFTSGVTILLKSSGVNDAVHHVVVSFEQTAALSGTTLGLYLQLLDGATPQCTIQFRSDGAIVLTSAGTAGTALATYTGAVTAASTWYAFEFEVVINNTTGSFTVRKNGNPVADFTATSLNTRGGTANNYANKLQLSMNNGINAQLVDDLFWRSDASSVAWLGDIRCYARMPVSDASVTFSRTSTGVLTQTVPTSAPSTIGISNALARFTPFTAAYSGTVTGVGVAVSAGNSGNMKCAIYADNGSGSPGVVLASATAPITPVATGTNVFTFSPGAAIVKGGQYWIAAMADTSTGTWTASNSPAIGATASASYATFPQSNPVASVGTPVGQMSWTYTATPANWQAVSEPQEDGLTSYVFDSTPGDADFYGVASIASTPAVVIATTIRAYMQKSDAGTRTAAVQLKSGATTVASPTLTLTTSGWLWAWRTDLTDPATGAAWTPAAVNNCTIGPRVVA